MEPNTTYIHYGDDTFRKPEPIVNRTWFTKPRGGLWASRVDDRQGWKNWCEAEDYCLDRLDRHFLFTLKAGAKVLELNHVDQLDNLPKLEPYNRRDRYDSCNLDFEKLSAEYDAIEVTDIGRLYWPLYGWDCNSILVMNPDIVNVVACTHEKHG